GKVDAPLEQLLDHVNHVAFGQFDTYARIVTRKSLEHQRQYVRCGGHVAGQAQRADRLPADRSKIAVQMIGLLQVVADMDKRIHSRWCRLNAFGGHSYEKVEPQRLLKRINRGGNGRLGYTEKVRGFGYRAAFSRSFNIAKLFQREVHRASPQHW